MKFGETIDSLMHSQSSMWAMSFQESWTLESMGKTNLIGTTISSKRELLISAGYMLGMQI